MSWKAVRKGDLESSYHMLRMCPHMVVGKEDRRMKKDFLWMRNEKAKKKFVMVREEIK